MDLPRIGNVKILIGKDGSSWYAVFEDFENIQESLIGFGEGPLDALNNLLDELGDEDYKKWLNKK